MQAIQRMIRLMLLAMLMVFALSPVVLFPVATLAEGSAGEPARQPALNQGQKWRIGYCETEPFSNYSAVFSALVQGLTEYGWLHDTEGLPYMPDSSDTVAMWAWLAANPVSDYLTFVPDAHYTISDMLVAGDPDPAGTIISRINGRQDLDVIIAFGTKAGQLLANDRHPARVFVFSASNAFASGIVQDVETSGSSHIWAHMDPTRFQRQLRVFQDLFKFRKLGIIYEDSEAGRAYAALGDVEQMAASYGFTIFREFVAEPTSEQDVSRYRLDMAAAYGRLAEQVDAFYLTVGSIDPDWLPTLLEPFNARKIPVFSQMGDSEVKAGALLSVTSSDFINIGRFGADTIIRALRGQPMNGLGQVYASTPQIILNFTTASKIGYKPTFDILLVADKIYH